MIFFDTSAILPIYFQRHIHHVPTRLAYKATPSPQRCCSIHSLAEVFNSATRHSAGIRAEPAYTSEILSSIKSNFRLIKLETGDYTAAADALVRLNFSGPLIYDALLLQAARKVNAETIYTWNVKHFQQLAPDLASRIRTP